MKLGGRTHVVKWVVWSGVVEVKSGRKVWLCEAGDGVTDERRVGARSLAGRLRGGDVAGKGQLT